MSQSIAIGWLGPTHDCWHWILSHFRDVTLLTDRSAPSWLELQSQASSESEPRVNAVLLLALESRSDDRLQFLGQFEQHVAPNSSVAKSVALGVLLGNDWVGHRRTFPLPESLHTFYWYELYDRLLPWLMSNSPDLEPDIPGDANGVGSKRRISPRVQRWIDTSMAIDKRLHPQPSMQSPKRVANTLSMAMIVTETALSRQLWSDGFSSQGIHCIATTPNHLEVWANPDLIVVDLESAPLEVQQAYDPECEGTPRERLVRQLKRQFPNAVLLVAEAFPRWETWNALQDCGADLMVAKPFQFTGIVDTLTNIATSS